MTSGCVGSSRRAGAALLGLSSRSAWTAASAARNANPARATSTGRRWYSTDLANSNGKPPSSVDAKLLLQVKKMVEQGLPLNRANAIASMIKEALPDSWGNAYLVSKEEMQKNDMALEAKLAKFKSEEQSSLEHRSSLFKVESEKLQGDIEKMYIELRYETDKVTAGQRLDLNLERGRIRDDIAKQNEKTTGLTTKLDREIHALRAYLEKTKNDVKRSCIGIVALASISVAASAIVRFMM